MNDAYAKNLTSTKQTNAEKAFCDSEFWKILGDDVHVAASAEKIAAWKNLAPKCSGSGLYESRLMGLMTSAGQIDDARRAGINALKQPLESTKEVFVALAQVELHADNFGLATSYAQRAVEADRQWFGGYTALGEVYLSEGKYTESVDALEAALDRRAGADVAASLSIAYREAHRYQDSVSAMQTALKGDMRTLRYTKAVAAAAYSLVQIGEVPAARDLLAKHAKLVPAAKEDPYFLHSVKVVADAMKAAKAKE